MTEKVNVLHKMLSIQAAEILYSVKNNFAINRYYHLSSLVKIDGTDAAEVKPPASVSLV